MEVATVSADQYVDMIDASVDSAIHKLGIDTVAQTLFTRFFDIYPETHQYFNKTDIASFAPRKFNIIREFLIDIIKHPDYVETEIINEVVRHQAYGLKDKEYYYALVDSFHDTIHEACLDEWNEELESCWKDISQAMKANIYQASQQYL